MNKISLIAIAIALSGCATQNAMPLGNNMMQIDVSAAPVYGRAGAQKMAFTKAAQATLDAGYDKFTIVDNAGWNESGISGGSYNTVNGTASGVYGGGGSYFSSHRSPEAKMVIKMFHNGDPGSAGAIDARAALSQK